MKVLTKLGSTVQTSNFIVVICNFIKKRHITLTTLPNVFLHIQEPGRAGTHIDLEAVTRRRVWGTLFTDKNYPEEMEGEVNPFRVL